ncbi:MAG: T9SS type A sorting domain-containing protein [Chitinophagaceae bacterium]|nr:T9SS type A sorting domain-containing protein [Chitinophagaceae bacterium]
MKLFLLHVVMLFSILTATAQQESIARRWNEAQLFAIRGDRARPPVQARNLYHVSLAMYEAWALYNEMADNYLLGHTINGTYYPFPSNIPYIGNDTLSSQTMAISYAAFRVLMHRYKNIPLAGASRIRFVQIMNQQMYDTAYHSTDFINGTPAAIGNYIAEKIIAMGLTDGANEIGDYANTYYFPINGPFVVTDPGAPNFNDVNRWQPLYILGATDQNNNSVPPLQKFIGPEWGNVLPYGLDPATAVTKTRYGNQFKVYFDQGGPSILDTLDGYDSLSMHYKWANALVSVWSSFLDPSDTTTIDISPASRGNLTTFPLTLNDQYSFYNLTQGGDPSTGHPVNPVTGLPYTPQLVKRGDYTRVVSQYWADGPVSETPPGHWYLLLNDVSDHPLCSHKFEGIGDSLPRLEWDIKSYLIMGGAIHDAAIAAWALKGWYDSPRPISAIRKMASYGQSSDSTLPSYHRAGLPLIPGFIELVQPGDSLAQINALNINKVKIKAWSGFTHINDPLVDVAGAGWIMGYNWWPYQRRYFVTPPFSGFVSGHSTYSRAGAEVLNYITGSPYFPGGLHEVLVKKDSNFLQIEHGPSTDITMQWATYFDASNESSLSRIYGGIHPPTDDGWGRYIGQQVATASYLKSKALFTAFSLPINISKFEITPVQCEAQVTIHMTKNDSYKQIELYRNEGGEEVLLQTYTHPASDLTINYRDEFPDVYSVYVLKGRTFENNIEQIASKAAWIGSCSDTYGIVKMYPNPGSTSVQLEIRSELEGDAFIQLIDLTGRVLQSRTFKLDDKIAMQTLNTTSLQTGQYVIRYVAPNGEAKSYAWLKQE